MAFDHRGKIKCWNMDRGFGFITLDGGDQIFAHATAFSRNVVPTEGLRVRCDIEDGPKGKRATRVVLD